LPGFFSYGIFKEMTAKIFEKIKFSSSEDTSQEIASSFLKEDRKLKEIIFPALLIAVVVGSGVLTGFILSEKLSGGEISSKASFVVAPGAEKKGREVGSKDIKTFRDTAKGILEKGGIDGEGSHKLIREGGPSQTVYLTSSIIDLDSFVGKKVQVWGETFSAQKAGWLMDVGRIKILG